MMSGHVEYQILVVTRLAAFKSAKHRPEDVVQFLVSWGLCQGAPEMPGVPGSRWADTPATRVRVASGSRHFSGAGSARACWMSGQIRRLRSAGRDLDRYRW